MFVHTDSSELTDDSGVVVTAHVVILSGTRDHRAVLPAHVVIGFTVPVSRKQIQVGSDDQ